MYETDDIQNRSSYSTKELKSGVISLDYLLFIEKISCEDCMIQVKTLSITCVWEKASAEETTTLIKQYDTLSNSENGKAYCHLEVWKRNSESTRIQPLQAWSHNQLIFNAIWH